MTEKSKDRATWIDTQREKQRDRQRDIETDRQREDSMLIVIYDPTIVLLSILKKTVFV